MEPRVKVLFLLKLFIYLFLAVLGLCGYAGLSLVAVSGGYSLLGGAWASPVAEYGLQAQGPQL